MSGDQRLYVGRARALLASAFGSVFFVPNARNRRWFHNIEFFAVTFNAIYASVSFVQRIGFSIFSTLVFMSRLDVCVLPSGFEWWDPGYCTYVGLLLTDSYYGNAVMITFARYVRHRARQGSRPPSPRCSTDFSSGTAFPQAPAEGPQGLQWRRSHAAPGQPCRAPQRMV